MVVSNETTFYLTQTGLCRFDALPLDTTPRRFLMRNRRLSMENFRWRDLLLQGAFSPPIKNPETRTSRFAAASRPARPGSRQSWRGRSPCAHRARPCHRHCRAGAAHRPTGPGVRKKPVRNRSGPRSPAAGHGKRWDRPGADCGGTRGRNGQRSRRRSDDCGR